MAGHAGRMEHLLTTESIVIALNLRHTRGASLLTGRAGPPRRKIVIEARKKDLVALAGRPDLAAAVRDRVKRTEY